jgi:hypothetical protein
MENVNIRWFIPEGWRVSPAPVAKAFLPNNRFAVNFQTLEFSIVAEKFDVPVDRCVVELTIDGQPTPMLVPVVLVNGNVPPCGATKPESKETANV